MFWFYSGELRLQGIFLSYAHRFLHDWTGTFGYMVLFIVFMVAFIALIVFQHVAFTSKRGSGANNNFWDFTNPGVLGVFNIIEFIWGFQFLRDACKSHLIQSISALLEAPLTGTGTINLPSATLHSRDFSLDIGAVSLEDLSLTHSLKFPPSLSNFSPVTVRLAVLRPETSAKTSAAVVTSSTLSVLIPMDTLTSQACPSATLVVNAIRTVCSQDSLLEDTTP